MAARIATCRILLKDTTQLPLRLCSLNEEISVSSEARLQWTKAILKVFYDQKDLRMDGHIRDWDLVLGRDGSVANVAQDDSRLLQTSTSLSPTTYESRYPAHYQLPATVLDRLDGQEGTRRQELFALGCLLYELNSEWFQSPFHDKNAEEVQAEYNQGRFPDDVWSSPTAIGILSCWCPEFALALRGSFFGRLGRHIQDHPVSSTFRVIGGLGALASCIAVPILATVGFAATGPVEGSATAAWQAGIGLVEAGSVFAWCQSAAMGGVAVGGIIATGVSAATVLAGATALQLLESRVPIPAPVLKEKFLKTWNRNL